MQILIQDLIDVDSDNKTTNAVIDIQSNRIAIVELTGGRNFNFEIRLSEGELPQQLVEIVHKLNSMGLSVDVENIYTRYMDA